MKSKDFLKEIVAKKKERISSAKLILSEEEIKSRVQGLPPVTRSFSKAINKPRQWRLLQKLNLLPRW